MELNRREFLTGLLAVGAAVSTPKFILAGLPVIEVDKDVAQQIADKEHKPVSEILWRGAAIYYNPIGYMPGGFLPPHIDYDESIPIEMVHLLKQDAVAQLGRGAYCELRTLIMPEGYKAGMAWVYGHQSNIGRRCPRTKRISRVYPTIQDGFVNLAPVLPGPYRLIEPFMT